MNDGRDVRLRELEVASRRLETSPEELNTLVGHATQLLSNFIKDLEDRPAYSAPAANRKENHGFTVPLKKTDAIDQLVEKLSSSGIQTASGHFMGYIPGGGIPGGAIADLITAITNRYSGFHFAAPDATELENEVIRWLISLFDMGENAWGTLTSGGSVATLTAVLAARETIKSKDWSKVCYYYTDQTHYVIERAIHIAGLVNASARKIPTDASFRMNVHALQQTIEKDMAEGLVPWAIFASAGTTNTGSIDPLEEISQLCMRHGIWFHVDAAYGGFFQLCDLGRKKLGPIQKADSIVLDPHKGLFLSYGTGAVLVKNHLLLKQAFSDTAPFLTDLSSEQGRSPADYSIELTRHSRAPRIWLCMKLFGMTSFASALEEKILLTEHLHASLSKFKGIEFACKPELSIGAFKLTLGRDMTKDLFDFLVDDGTSYVSSTMLAGRLYIRVCILSFRTHKNHVDSLISKIAGFIQSAQLDKQDWTDE